MSVRGNWTFDVCGAADSLEMELLRLPGRVSKRGDGEREGAGEVPRIIGEGRKTRKQKMVGEGEQPHKSSVEPVPR